MPATRQVHENRPLKTRRPEGVRPEIGARQACEKYDTPDTRHLLVRRGQTHTACVERARGAQVTPAGFIRADIPEAPRNRLRIGWDGIRLTRDWRVRRERRRAGREGG